MIKIIKYTAVLIFGFLWFIGCSKDVSKYMFDKHLLKDDYRYGDLYRLSNLSDFRVPLEVCKKSITFQNQNVTLFLAGDSFTEDSRIDSSYFISQRFVKGKVAEPNVGFEPIVGKKILVIETVERHFRERFAQPWQNWKTKSKAITKDSSNVFDLEKLAKSDFPYNKETHEAAIFGSDFFLFFKEIKAAINQKIFGKIDDKVKLTPDGKHLLYFLDVEPGVSSSFAKIENSEIDNMVENVNKTRYYYKSIGFSEVIFSIIPNKTSILGRDLGDYNQLIRRIENHENLKSPFLSIINEFEQGKDKLYDKGDTHWNCTGKKIWVDKVNAALVKF